MGVSVWQILIVLLIVLLLFGTKKLRNIGGDLGEAVKGFKKGMASEGSTDEVTDMCAGNTAKSIEHSRESDSSTASFSEQNSAAK